MVPDDAPLDGSAAAGAAAGGKKKRAPAPFVDAIIAELSSQRKLTVGKFNGKVSVGIREARGPTHSSVFSGEASALRALC